MEKLIAHIMYCLRACVKAEHNKEIWLHQAFGAVQYHINLFPGDFELVEAKWNELKPHFERHIYGISFDLRRN